jgi:para-nitrobenzyl esterase
MTRTYRSTITVAFIVAAACGEGGGDHPLDATAGFDAPSVDAATACTSTSGAASERVATTSGIVRGAQDGATWSYKGVPFAAPPTGARRFAAPAAAACSTVEIDATHVGPVCPQLDKAGVFSGDEDCLQLNVWAPSGAANPRPVMVWIHGGGNVAGSAIDAIYDGRRLAEAGDVVVVSINYRLGQLGFLADAGLAVGGSVGNYGILDQIAALRWIHDNVAAFGGDPSTVMVFGESAGARDTCTLLATPGSAGLFHRALIESGSCKFIDTVAEGQTVADRVVAALGCDVASDRIACLRAATPEALTRAAAAPAGVLDSATFGPVLDGVVLAEQPEAAILAGRHHAMPIAIGANSEETGREAPATLTLAQYQTLVRAQYGAIADRVLQQYPGTPTPRAAYVRVTTDSRFVCPSRQIAIHADLGQSPSVFRYFFTHQAAAVGAVHALEIPYVFGTFSSVIVNGNPYQPTAADLRISTAMQGYWTRFARTGDPGGTPAWPAHDPTDPVIVLDDPVTTTTGVRAVDCDFWAPYYDAL